jgi:hypothetical protein
VDWIEGHASGFPKCRQECRHSRLERLLHGWHHTVGSTVRRYGYVCYDGDIMMARSQISLEPEIQRRARQRASDLGVSLAEYVRRLVARDLGGASVKADPARVFDLGKSSGSDIAKDKRAMIAEAFGAGKSKRRRLKSRQ